MRELGATEVVEGIENATGRFALILESSGGTSLSTAIKLIEPDGTVAVYGNSAGTASSISFGDFRGAQNARIQSFFYFTSEAEDKFAPDLDLLVMPADPEARVAEAAIPNIEIAFFSQDVYPGHSRQFFSAVRKAPHVWVR